MSESHGVVYRINEEGELIYANEAWNAFAHENGADHLVTPTVYNQSLWSFIRDPTTRLLYEEILESAQRGAEQSFTFRCDAPTLRRTLRMRVFSTSDGGTEFQTSTIHVEERANQPILDVSTPRSGDVVMMCAWCQRIEIEDSWTSVEDAVVLLDLFTQDEMPRVSHGICPDCHTRILGGIVTV